MAGWFSQGWCWESIGSIRQCRRRKRWRKINRRRGLKKKLNMGANIFCNDIFSISKFFFLKSHKMLFFFLLNFTLFDAQCFFFHFFHFVFLFFLFCAVSLIYAFFCIAPFFFSFNFFFVVVVEELRKKIFFFFNVIR